MPTRLGVGPPATFPLPLPVRYPLQLLTIHFVWLRTSYPQMAKSANPKSRQLPSGRRGRLPWSLATTESSHLAETYP